ncbi:MAG: polysaccharide pyruvyl transferase family protein [Limnochordaceae bacterium]|nr:polysaccharide pyruvyl transferase family protein [Limnochordaceae bacterium]
MGRRDGGCLHRSRLRDQYFRPSPHAARHHAAAGVQRDGPGAARRGARLGGGRPARSGRQAACPAAGGGRGAAGAIATGTRRHPLKILFSGYYGFGNLGDEAVLAGALRGLRRHLGEDARLVVLSSDPPITRQLHRVEAESRAPGATWRAVRGATVLVSGGGSLLQDVTSVRSLLYYLFVMELARLHGARVVWFAQGIGPVRRSWLRRLVAWEANRAAAVTVRDEASRHDLVAMGVDPARVQVVADAAWLLAEPQGAAGSPRFPRHCLPLRRRAARTRSGPVSRPAWYGASGKASP